MKAMIWKELRENLKWAVLAMFGLALAEFYGLTTTGSYSYEDQAATLCKSSFLMVTTFGSAAVGIVLGLIQILPEQRRDQWAALVHRPVSRATIFRGKAFAGILLYLIATILPFLACVWYTVAPGHFAVPFVPQMVLAGAADTCGGVMFYFAALFVGLRRGFWFGTRAFGFLAAVTAAFFIAASPAFDLAVEASVLMTLMLFTAGWGAILSNGRLRDQPRLAQYALITVVFFGVCFLGTLALIVTAMFGGQAYYYGSEYKVDVDGRPLKFTSSKSGATVITDLAGNVIHDKRFVGGSSYTYLLYFAQVSGYVGSPHDLRDAPNRYYTAYRRNQGYVVSAAGVFDSEAERWYYLPTERQFVGYFFKTNQRIGSIGQDGFKPGHEKAAPLADYKASVYYQVPAISQFGETVYHSDFDQRKLTPIFSQQGTTVFGAVPMESFQDSTIQLNWGAVALLDKMLIIDKSGQVMATLPYHQDMDRWGSLSVAVKPGKDRFFLSYEPSIWIGYKERAKMPSFYEEMDAKGNLLNTYTLPPIKPEQGTRSWLQYVSECLPPPAFLFGGLAFEKIGALCGSESLARELDHTLEDGWGYFKDVAIRSSVTSMLLALVALVWARKRYFSLERALIWALFVLAFNLAGLITFRLVADWPTLVRCPQCSRKRPVDEDKCPHCSSLWPAPKPTGIEIFDEKIPAAQTES